MTGKKRSSLPWAAVFNFLLLCVEKNVSRFLKVAITCAALVLPVFAWAQGKIAVVNVQEAILQTDYAQKRLAAVRNQDDYKSDKAEFDRLKDEFDELVKKLQTDMAVMSQDQQKAARQKLSSKQGDLEHVTGKLQRAEQSAGQTILQEMSPRVQEVLRDLISTEGKIDSMLVRKTELRGH